MPTEPDKEILWLGSINLTTEQQLKVLAWHNAAIQRHYLPRAEVAAAVGEDESKRPGMTMTQLHDIATRNSYRHGIRRRLGLTSEGESHD
jgi:hypothetical protein